jgi:hypothetical protein
MAGEAFLLPILHNMASWGVSNERDNPAELKANLKNLKLSAMAGR